MYTPILKNRSVEMECISQLYNIPISKKILPLIEIVQEKTKSTTKKTLVEELKESFNYNKTKATFMVDIIKTNVPNSTTDSVKNFLNNVNNKPNYYINIFESLKEIENLIPVISYNMKSFNASKLNNDIILLRNTYSKLAFRIKSANFNDAFSILENKIVKNDIVILDVDNTTHTSPLLKRYYNRLKALKSKIDITTIIVNSTKGDDITNSGLHNAEPIENIDNSLRDMYNLPMYGFSGFGDYACLKNELPGKGGVISPGSIYYSCENNFFVGFKGRKNLLSEFEDFIAPSIIESLYWTEYTDAHHEQCPGCEIIKKIAEKEENGKSQGKWKGITVLHYIYTIDRYLNNNL